MLDLSIPAIDQNDNHRSTRVATVIAGPHSRWCLLALAVVLISLGAWGIAQDQAATPDAATVNALVRQLGSDQFAIRQEATRRLLEFGPAALELLAAWRDEGDREMKERLRAIVTAIRLRVPLDSAYVFTDVVQQFEFLPDFMQVELLRMLAAENRSDFLLDLVDSVPNQASALELQMRAFPINKMLATWANESDTPQLVALLRHPFLQRHYPELSFNGLRLLGQIDNEAEAWLARVANRPASDADLVTAYVALRTAGRTAEAKPWLERITDPALRERQVTDWHLRLADWDYFLGDVSQREWARDGVRLAELDDEAIRSLALELTVARIAQHPSRFARAREIVARLLKAGEQLTDETKPKFVILANTLLINGEVDLALAAAERLDTGLALAIADSVHDNLAMARILQIPEEPAERWRWLNRHLDELRRLQTETDVSDLNASEEHPVVKKYRQLLAACEYCAESGHNTDAVVFLESLLANVLAEDRFAFEQRSDIILRLANQQPANFWQTVESVGSNNHYQMRYVQNYLFRPQNDLGEFWIDALRDTRTYSREGLRGIAKILHSPLAERDDDFRIDPIIESIDRSTAAERYSDTPGQIHFMLGLTYLAHGRWADYESMLQTAVADYQHRKAALYLGRDAHDRRDWDAAIPLLELATREFDTDNAALLMLMRAYRETGNPKEMKAKLAALFLQDTYLTADRVEELVSYGFADMLLEIKPDGYLANHLWFGRDDVQATHWSDSHLIDIVQNFVEHVEVYFLIDIYRKSLIHRAALLSQQANPEAAAALIAEAGPAIVSYGSLCELLAPLLEQRGQSATAERIFEMQAAWFIDRLKKFPENPSLLNNFAWTCASACRRLREATYCCERALALRPGNRQYLDTLATLYHLQGRHVEAIALNELCLRQDPSYPHYRVQRQRFLSGATNQDEGARLK